jgi:ATP-dependent 26S proteasome regulatory subunit
MPQDDKVIEALREALRASPGNVPIRKHLGDLLLNRGDVEDAESEYRHALSLSPDDEQIKLSLADSFFRQHKNSAASVILEEMVAGGNPPPQALLLAAQVALRSGELSQASRFYKQAIQMDPALSDPDIESQLVLNRGDDLGDSDAVEKLVNIAGEELVEMPELDIEKPELTFKDVGGMKDLKEEIRMKIIHPLTNPALFEAYGKKAGGGILMYGPPGCGKTYLSKATAGEVNASFLIMGIHDILDMYIGESERKLHGLFEQARACAPCVLFFDEVDALAAKRSDMRRSGGRQLINQFLSELDGIDASNDELLVLAATNAPWHLDAAFRRPGRFDRVLFVPPPDREARAAILDILSRGKPVTGVDFEKIAKKTTGFSGADLKAVVDIAVEAKLREAMEKGQPEPLMDRDFLSALKKIKPTTKEWFSTARNYALYSNPNGMYDDVLAYLKIRP